MAYSLTMKLCGKQGGSSLELFVLDNQDGIRYIFWNNLGIRRLFMYLPWPDIWDISNHQEVLQLMEELNKMYGTMSRKNHTEA